MYIFELGFFSAIFLLTVMFHLVSLQFFKKFNSPQSSTPEVRLYSSLTFGSSVRLEFAKSRFEAISKIIDFFCLPPQAALPCCWWRASRLARWWPSWRRRPRRHSRPPRPPHPPPRTTPRGTSSTSPGARWERHRLNCEFVMHKTSLNIMMQKILKTWVSPNCLSWCAVKFKLQFFFNFYGIVRSGDQSVKKSTTYVYSTAASTISPYLHVHFD